MKDKQNLKNKGSIMCIIASNYNNNSHFMNSKGVFCNSSSEMGSNAVLSCNCPNMMQCRDCENACRVISTYVMLNNFVVIEPSTSIMNRIQFESRITVK